MKKLYIFTVKYPFSNYAECFIEDEIKFLSKAFDHIEIIPLQSETANIKPLPDNCQPIQPVFGGKLSFLFNGLFNWRVLRKMFPLLFKNGTLTDSVHRTDWVKAYTTATNLLNNKDVKRIERNLQPSDVCYFYWGKWSNLLACFWKGKCHLVSRFHGEGDLWEECHKGYVPLRKEVIDALDAAVFISSKGEKYFQERYPNCRTKFFPLGSNDINFATPVQNNTVKVLSCSTVSALKRVTLIFQSLLEVKDMEIEWTHIGDGVEFEKLKGMVAESNSQNVKVILPGWMQHDDVLDYYSTHGFDVFVNLSTNEGVPVSIMEAICCNIPVVATNVGGNSEIVTTETGQLVSANPTPQEVAEAITAVVKGHYTPREFWDNHYNAEKNYTAFAQFLTNL
jgi:glycosyltransferase involved in cell wall biosynthesis